MSSYKKHQLISDYFGFSQASVDWMITQSETDVGRVSQTLNLIIQDVDRRSSLSKDTLSLLDNVKERLEEISSQREVSAREVIKSLSAIGEDETEVVDLVTPLIKSLQFQDRLKHMLCNYKKMYQFWIDNRVLFEKKELTSKEIQDLGCDMLKLTSTSDERKIIRNVIKGLPDNDQKENQILFDD